MPDMPINQLTADIVSAYARSNHLNADQVATLISSVHQALSGVDKPADAPAERTPAVPIRRSVSHEHVVCLECGWRGKTLRRHLSSRHGLNPGEYRAAWNLRPQHLLTAPGYSERRSSMAKELGLGRGRGGGKIAAARTPARKDTSKPRTTTKRSRAIKAGTHKTATGGRGRARS